MFLSFLEGLPAARCITDLDFLHFLNELIPIIVSCIYFYLIFCTRLYFIDTRHNPADIRTDEHGDSYKHQRFSQALARPAPQNETATVAYKIRQLRCVEKHKLTVIKDNEDYEEIDIIPKYMHKIWSVYPAASEISLLQGLNQPMLVKVSTKPITLF